MLSVEEGTVPVTTAHPEASHRHCEYCTSRGFCEYCTSPEGYCDNSTCFGYIATCLGYFDHGVCLGYLTTAHSGDCDNRMTTALPQQHCETTV